MPTVLEVHDPKTKTRLFATVDEEDFEALSKKRLVTFVTRSGVIPVWRDSLGTRISIANLIISIPPGYRVEYADGNGMNNRKKNLLLVPTEKAVGPSRQKPWQRVLEVTGTIVYCAQRGGKMAAQRCREFQGSLGCACSNAASRQQVKAVEAMLAEEGVEVSRGWFYGLVRGS